MKKFFTRFAKCAGWLLITAACLFTFPVYNYFSIGLIAFYILVGGLLTRLNWAAARHIQSRISKVWLTLFQVGLIWLILFIRTPEAELWWTQLILSNFILYPLLINSIYIDVYLWYSARPAPQGLFH